MTIKNPSGDNEECWTAMGLADGAVTSNRELTSEMASLSQTIEGEIIPRLMVMFESESSPVFSGSAQRQIPEPPYTGDVEEFVKLILTHSIEVPTQYITALIDQGARLKNIYLDLLAPSARHLGEMWNEDECDFTQVTIGVARMHQLLHMFSPVFCAYQSTDPDMSHSAMIVPMPGEQHTFGHLMVVEFFRREGWNVWSGAPETEEDILERIAQQPFSIIGLSVSTDRHLDRLPTFIQEIRDRSSSDGIKILVGGRAFLETDHNPKDYGADGSAIDGEEAVQLATTLV
ncbi:MAG: B12-binding domain-containing protein [Gammaproteobacteria bacterium]